MSFEKLLEEKRKQAGESGEKESPVKLSHASAKIETGKTAVSGNGWQDLFEDDATYFEKLRKANQNYQARHKPEKKKKSTFEILKELERADEERERAQAAGIENPELIPLSFEKNEFDEFKHVNPNIIGVQKRKNDKQFDHFTLRQANNFAEKNGVSIDTDWQIAVVANDEAALIRELDKEQEPGNLRDEEGRTPLLWAVWAGNHELIPLLCKRGYRLDLRDNDGGNALHYAAINGSIRQFEIIAEDNMHLLHTTTRHGWDVLHIAGYFQKEALFTHLINKYPFMLNRRDQDDKNILELVGDNKTLRQEIFTVAKAQLVTGYKPRAAYFKVWQKHSSAMLLDRVTQVLEDYYAKPKQALHPKRHFCGRAKSFAYELKKLTIKEHMINGDNSLNTLRSAIDREIEETVTEIINQGKENSGEIAGSYLRRLYFLQQMMLDRCNLPAAFKDPLLDSIAKPAG